MFIQDPIHTVKLSSGETVRLPEWRGMKPPKHGEELEDASYNPKTGARPQFYDATAEWMRNEGANKTLHGQNVSLDQQSIRLFYFPATKTWHASDGLDIDHQTPWREHLIAKGVDNRADAMRAYNDIDNLRVVPSFYNRARGSADKILDTHGVDSKQWRNWVAERMDYDHSVKYPAFDPERDLARRGKSTLDTPWTDENTRSDLRFDTRVLDKWFNHALQESYAGTVAVRNPQTDQMDQVPLFRCAASGQLTTRDALDIDHEIPYEIIADKMRELFPNHVITKADMLDVYNDTSNLRLVTRGVNSSHEYERDPMGEWRDKIEPEKPGEFDKLIKGQGSLDKQTVELIRRHYLAPTESGEKPSLPKVAASGPVHMLVPRRMDEPDNLRPLSPQQLAGSDASLVRPESPYHGITNKVSGIIDRISESDPRFYAQMREINHGERPAPGHLENIATTLIAAAKTNGMTRIDGIVTNQDRTSLFVYQGNGHGEVINRVEVPLKLAMQFSVEENSRSVHKMDQMALQQGQQQTQQQGHKQY